MKSRFALLFAGIFFLLSGLFFPGCGDEEEVTPPEPPPAKVVAPPEEQDLETHREALEKQKAEQKLKERSKERESL